MRIGIVLPSVPGYSETFFRSKILGLLENGFEVILFVKNRKGINDFLCPVVQHPILSANPFVRIFQSFFIFFKTIMVSPIPTRNLWNIAKENGFSVSGRIKTIVIASAVLPYKLDWLHFGFATPALEREFIGKAIGAKVAVSFRGFDINQIPLLDFNVYNLLWKYVDKVHSISNYLVDRAHDLGLEKSTPFVKITPALDVSKFINRKRVVKPNSILLVSRLHWIKGIQYFLEAISILKKKDVKCNVSIAGEGEELESLVFACYQLGIEDSVTFLGKVNHSEVSELMNIHEIFVQYSHQEGFCNAVLEAQASEMLCIVSDAEGLRENVLHEETGWVVPKRNPEFLANQIESVLNLHESEKEKTRNNARKRINEEFNLEKQKRAFVDFYRLKDAV